MKLPSKVELAIKIIKVIQNHPGITSKNIAELLSENENKIRKMTAKLASEGLVLATKGMRGGYQLDGGITLQSLLEAIDPGSFSSGKNEEDQPGVGLYLVNCDIVAAFHSIYIT